MLSKYVHYRHENTKEGDSQGQHISLRKEAPNRDAKVGDVEKTNTKQNKTKTTRSKKGEVLLTLSPYLSHNFVPSLCKLSS